MLRTAVLAALVVFAASLYAEPAQSTAQPGSTVQLAALGGGGPGVAVQSGVSRHADSVRVDLAPEHARRHVWSDRSAERGALSGVLISALTFLALGLAASR